MVNQYECLFSLVIEHHPLTFLVLGNYINSFFFIFLFTDYITLVLGDLTKLN